MGIRSVEGEEIPPGKKRKLPINFRLPPLSLFFVFFIREIKGKLLSDKKIITVVVVGRWCGKRSVGGFSSSFLAAPVSLLPKMQQQKVFYYSRDKMEIFVSCQKEESNYAHEKEGNRGRLCIYVDTHSHNDGREYSCCRRCSFIFLSR